MFAHDVALLMVKQKTFTSGSIPITSYHTFWVHWDSEARCGASRMDSRTTSGGLGWSRNRRMLTSMALGAICRRPVHGFGYY